MMDTNFLGGKVVLITGAGSGFGRKMAITFASKGANLVLNDINMAGLEETQSLLLENNKVDTLLVQADISDIKQVKEMRTKTFEKFDNVYIIVNNAGIDGGLYKSLAASPKVYDKVMAVNVKGAWNVTKTFHHRMKGQRNFKPIRGKIINIASCAGTESGLNPYLGIYSASKAALIAFTKLWALELGSSNITVNSISPGLFLTPIYKDDKTIKMLMEQRGIKLPINRIGMPQEVADIALFLASSAADYITGHNLVLDGGMIISVNKL